MAISLRLTVFVVVTDGTAVQRSHHFGEYAAKREDVGGSTTLFPVNNFRSAVHQGMPKSGTLGHARVFIQKGMTRAKVGKYDFAILHQDIARLDVFVSNALRVDESKGAGKTPQPLA
jgi:hypothetical protein